MANDEIQHYLYDKKGQFHRLYLESCSCLLGLDLWQINQYYSQGVSSNLTLSKFDPKLLRYTQSDLADDGVEVEGLVQLMTTDLYEGADENTLSIVYKLRHLVSSKALLSREQVNHLVTSLKERLVQSKSDCLARFLLAWLNFHYLNEYAVACANFELVSTRVEDDSPYFAILALRYHARSLAMLGRNLESYSAQYYAIQLSRSVSQQFDYELAQYAFYNEQYLQQAQIQIRSFIKENTFNYLLCQSNSYINEIPDVSHILAHFHQAKLEEISDLTWQQWSTEQPEILKTLVTDKTEGSLEAVFSQYMELLAYQPYVVLYHSDQIKNKILKNLSGKAKGVCQSLDEILKNKIAEKRHTYTWVNKVGHKFVYAAIILVLSTIFVYIADLLLPSTYQSVNWVLWLPVLATVTLVGITLTRFSPPNVKKMLSERQIIAKELTRSIHP
ncbi:MAG: hypothetical protein KAH22_07320 [Thiotrichaceae bacterium]|nr:hypothetical protein [Thiotrichaceae bacterium]